MLILNLYQSVIPTSMVADFFKQLLIEKWKQNVGQKVRDGCTVPGPATPHKHMLFTVIQLCQNLSQGINSNAKSKNKTNHKGRNALIPSG